MEKLANGKPMYEVITPDGSKFELWLDGRVVGFPAHSMVINRALPLVQTLDGWKTA